MKRKNILFICKHNVFRSKTAEAYFKKINKNKNLHIESAGFIKGDVLRKPDQKMADLEKKVLKKRGITFKRKSNGLSIGLMKKQDLIIIISNDLPNIFTEGYLKKSLKVRIWKIKDVVTGKDGEEEINRVVSRIIKKVDSLIKELK